MKRSTAPPDRKRIARSILLVDDDTTVLRVMERMHVERAMGIARSTPYAKIRDPGLEGG